MSPDPRAWHDKQEGECRLARALWRRCYPIHVALRTRAERHANASMSLRIPARRDIPTHACRSGSAPGATSQPLHVARRARERRHAGAKRSPHEGVQCDLHREQCRSTRSPQATCGAQHVAGRNRLERQERPGTCRTGVSWSDIVDRIGRLTRPGSTTWTCTHVASPRMVKRHSLVRWMLQATRGLVHHGRMVSAVGTRDLRDTTAAARYGHVTNVWEHAPTSTDCGDR
jgi:hypothetical protein